MSLICNVICTVSLIRSQKQKQKQQQIQLLPPVLDYAVDVCFRIDFLEFKQVIDYLFEV